MTQISLMVFRLPKGVTLISRNDSPGLAITSFTVPTGKPSGYRPPKPDVIRITPVLTTVFVGNVLILSSL